MKFVTTMQVIMQFVGSCVGGFSDCAQNGGATWHGNRLRPGGRFALNDQVQQVLAHVLLIAMIGSCFAEISKFAHGPQVTVNGTFGFTGQSQVIDHFLEKYSFEKLGLSG